jgi:hypothetical protein
MSDELSPWSVNIIQVKLALMKVVKTAQTQGLRENLERNTLLLHVEAGQSESLFNKVSDKIVSFPEQD